MLKERDEILHGASHHCRTLLLIGQPVQVRLLVFNKETQITVANYVNL